MFVSAFLGALCGLMLAFPENAARGAQDALTLFATRIAPSLMPLLTLMLLFSSRIRMNLFRALPICYLMGSPGGTKIYQRLSCKGKDAYFPAAATGTISPMFFLSSLSAWTGDAALSAYLFCFHVSGALLCGFFFTPRGQRSAPLLPASPLLLGDAVRESALAMLSIAGCMALGQALCECLSAAFSFLSLSQRAILQAMCEVTSGARAITLLPLPTFERVLLLQGAVSFGGLSLLMQNAVLWKESGVKMGRLILYRCIHAALSCALSAGYLMLTGCRIQG